MRLPDLAVPFRGERYAALDRLSRLVAPPYDVISSSERARYAAQDAHNIVHVMLPEAPGGGDRYARAAQVLTEWRSERTLVRDGEPAVYVLAQDFALPSGERRSRVGVFVALAAEGYEPRRVRPHERTHAGPKADRLALLRTTQTSLESIFVLAPDSDGELAKVLRAVVSRAPDATAELAGVGMRLWIVPGGAATEVTSLVNRGPVYIADGHHRYETASSYAAEHRQVDRLLTFVVSAKEPGLVILPTHRVIYGAPVEPRDFASLWSQMKLAVTDVDRASAPDRRSRWGLVWAGGVSQQVDSTSTPQLSEFEDIAMGDFLVSSIVAQAGTAQIVYTPDAAEAVASVAKGATAAVLLPAPHVETVFEVADGGGIMPPKSTYFFPKVPAGLVLADWR
jgi:uncharacterized protein (DUF1015 family)